MTDAIERLTTALADRYRIAGFQALLAEVRPRWEAVLEWGRAGNSDGQGRSHYLPPIMDRSRMTARVVPLASVEAGDARMGGTPEERLAAVAALTAEAWRLACRPLPTYTRATMPVVVATLKDHAGST